MPVLRSSCSARAVSSRNSGGVISFQLILPASSSSRVYPTMRRNSSLALMTGPSRAPEKAPTIFDSTSCRMRISCPIVSPCVEAVTGPRVFSGSGMLRLISPSCMSKPPTPPLSSRMGLRDAVKKVFSRRPARSTTRHWSSRSTAWPVPANSQASFTAGHVEDQHSLKSSPIKSRWFWPQKRL